MSPAVDRALLDTSVVIDYPSGAVAAHAMSAAVSTITLAELAYGLHTPDPLVNAAREQRYHWIVNTFGVVTFDAGTARIYGALCASIRPAATGNAAASTFSSLRSQSPCGCRSLRAMKGTSSAFMSR